MKIKIEVLDEVPYQIVAMAYRRALKENHSKEIISKSKKYKIYLKIGRKIKTIKLKLNE